MINFLDFIERLYPDKPKAEQERLALWCEENAAEYYPETWKRITSEDLDDEKVQMHLVRTLYQLQYGYYEGVVQGIAESFLLWTNGTVIFPLMDDELQAFYQRYFAFLTFQNFRYLTAPQQSFVLGTRFLVLGMVWKLPVLDSVQLYFATYCDVDILKTDAALFAGTISRNLTVIEDADEKASKTIQQWIQTYDAFTPKDKEEKMVEFFDQVISKTTIEENVRLILRDIIVLHDLLITDAIWKNLDYSLCTHARSERDPSFNRDEFYVHRLEQANDITAWLNEYEETAAWFQNKPETLKKRLMKVLSQKVDLSDTKKVDLLLKFLHGLNEEKWEGALFFNEQDGTFHWNEELVT